MLHEPQGHDGKYLIIEYRIKQYPGTVGFPGSDIGQLMSGSVIFKELPGAAAGFSHGKGLPLKIGNSQFLTSIKGMLLSNGQYQTVICKYR